jgi:dCTP deaminase
MTTLSSNTLRDRLNDTNLEDLNSLVITPLVDDKQIGEYSIDLRLANQFIVFKSQNIKSHDVFDLQHRADVYKLQEEHVVEFGDDIVIHPGELILASTIEYLRIPLDLEGKVDGRSSWARLGLVIATAACIDPGFIGSITLELSNLGKSPLVLSPGIRICQLVLRTTTGEKSYSLDRKYRCAIGPEFTRIYDDPEIDRIIRMRKRREAKIKQH